MDAVIGKSKADFGRVEKIAITELGAIGKCHCESGVSLTSSRTTMIPARQSALKTMAAISADHQSFRWEVLDFESESDSASCKSGSMGIFSILVIIAFTTSVPENPCEPT